MADFGSNFTEAFSAVMGAGLKARALKTQERREAAEDAYTKSERDRVARQRIALGGAGNQLIGDASDTTGFKTPEQYQSDQGLPAAAPTSAEIMSRLNTPGPKGYAPAPMQTQALPQPVANTAPPPPVVQPTSALPPVPMATTAPVAAPETITPNPDVAVADRGYGYRYGTQQEPDKEKWGTLPPYDTPAKGNGYYGMLGRTDQPDQQSSEYSIGVTVNGKNYHVPSLVPGMTQLEIDSVLSGKPLPTVQDKAQAWAQKRIDQKLPVYATAAEEGKYKPATEASATTQGEKAPTFEFKPNAEVANDPAQRNPNVSVTDSPVQASAVSKDGTVTAVAAGTKGVEKKPESGDYVQVNLDGKEVYVPKERTKQLHGSDLMYAKAEAMFGPDGDPVIAAQLYEGAQRIEANNIKLTSQRAEQAITKAYQVFLSNPQDGLTSLAGAINENNLGGLGKVELTWLDNGDAQVRHYAMTANGKHYVDEPKLVKANELVDAGKQLFNQALSSTSGEAITNGVLRDADLATRVQAMAYNRAAEKRAAELFPVQRRALEANIDQSRASTRASNETVAASQAERVGGYSKKAFAADAKDFQTSVSGRAKELREADPSLSYAMSVATAKSEVLPGMSPAFRNAMEQSAGVVDVPGMSEPAPAPAAKPKKGQSPLNRGLTAPLTNPFTNKPVTAPNMSIPTPSAYPIG